MKRRHTSSVLKEVVIEYSRSALIAALIVHTLSPIWQFCYQLWPYSDRSLFVVLTMVIHDTLYYACHYFMQMCEEHGWLQQYKIPRTKGQIPSTDLIQRTLKEAAFGHFVLQPVTLYLLYPYLVNNQESNDIDSLPSIFELTINYIYFMFINDLLFFLVHTLLHENRWLYAKVHKQHHMYSGSIGIAAEFAHPVEQILGNQLPVVLPVLYFKTHIWTWIIYVFWRLWRTYESHSGYSFAGTWLSKLGFLHGHMALYHDFHHSANLGNYNGPSHGVGDHLLSLITGRSYEEAWLKHCATTTFQPEVHKRWLS